MVLDGNPLDEEGLNHLCIALLRNRCIETVSLRRCGLSDRGGLLLLRLHEEKPGLEVDCTEGNHFGEDMQLKASRSSLLPRLFSSSAHSEDHVYIYKDQTARKTYSSELWGGSYGV